MRGADGEPGPAGGISPGWAAFMDGSENGGDMEEKKGIK
jgi:hypothetical protein